MGVGSAASTIVIVATGSTNTLSWYSANPSGNWSQHLISSTVYGARCAVVAPTCWANTTAPEGSVPCIVTPASTSPTQNLYVTACSAQIPTPGGGDGDGACRLSLSRLSWRGHDRWVGPSFCMHTCVFVCVLLAGCRCPRGFACPSGSSTPQLCGVGYLCPPGTLLLSPLSMMTHIYVVFHVICVSLCVRAHHSV